MRYLALEVTGNWIFGNVFGLPLFAPEEDTNNKQQMETFLSHFPLTKANKLKLPEVETDYCIIDTNF